MSSELLAALVAHLLEHAVRVDHQQGFQLKSGRRSPWFLDAKKTTCSPEGMVAVADAMLEVLPPEVTALGGLTVGADASAYATAGIAAARGRHLNAFTVRKETKDHGAGGRIAGVLERGDKVAITEDAVTRGVSMLEAAEEIAAASGEDSVTVALPPPGETHYYSCSVGGGSHCTSGMKRAPGWKLRLGARRGSSSSGSPSPGASRS